MKEFIESQNFLVALDFTKSCKIWYGLQYRGSDKLYYELWFNGELLFKGNDYRPSPINNIDDLESVIGGLGFLTLQEGAVDNEYFKDYTPKQIEFRDSTECENLNILLSDCEFYLMHDDPEDIDEIFYSEAYNEIKSNLIYP